MHLKKKVLKHQVKTCFLDTELPRNEVILLLVRPLAPAVGTNTSGQVVATKIAEEVSLMDVKGPTLLYQKQIANEISTGIISLQFRTCSRHCFKKNVLVVATKDSSVLAVDVDTGNMLSTSTVHPKKPSEDVLAGGSNVSNDPDMSKGNPVEDSPKQSSLLICSEKAVYLVNKSRYPRFTSLGHVMLHYENLKGINQRATKVQGTAKSYSDMARELLQKG
ncbi:hypothetical protein GH714_034900 [Hevea brasiliensis]|uniref:Uncharacterized protein n=1 Tax=Hevea brasiliensis TaxID=3981 RepID=A0A6A6MJ04_HEVBR|nr:hypothetical protein GH714_034900 [Hevea brasiliensis]